ncbi:uncharacterized protein LOC135083104 [Ostrinia nubilalis]|uniref:uncharacterized protein LOC135083104 n=1 Tax=Ostrinia nubilalis TaxID=29057 RepID=UPI0030822A47
MKKDAWKKLSQIQKEKWLCPSCSSALPKSDNSASPARPAIASCGEQGAADAENVNITRGSRTKTTTIPCTDSVVNLSDILRELTKLREEVGEIKVLRKEFVNLRTQVLSISTTLNETLTDYRKKLEDAEREISTLKCTLLQSQRDQERQEQNAICDELEVAGIPEENNEDLLKTIIITSNKLGVDLKETDVSYVTRAGPRPSKASQGTKPRPILVKLVRRIKRDEIIKASKLQKKLTTEGVSPGPHKAIYINERLTFKNRMLFRDARLRSRTQNFRFCWVRHGSIYVRENENKPAIRIQCHEDLDCKIGPAGSSHP